MWAEGVDGRNQEQAGEEEFDPVVAGSMWRRTLRKNSFKKYLAPFLGRGF
jgi:hypothetical protein